MEAKEGLKEIFVFPSLENERGEIERAAGVFAGENTDAFVSSFMEAARVSELVPLPEEEWAKLENTDSHDIPIGDWGMVKYHSDSEGRDWQSLKTKIESGESLDAPIILKTAGKLHLVSGNTRLMVSRAIGITPKVLLVNM
ncbi:MAG: hypothetical protein WCG97_01090 [bacterium]